MYIWLHENWHPVNLLWSIYLSASEVPGSLLVPVKMEPPASPKQRPVQTPIQVCGIHWGPCYIYIRLYNLMNPWIHYTIYKTVQHWALSCMIFSFCWDQLPLLWRSPNRLWVQHALLPLKLKPSLVFPGLNWVFTANDCYHIIWYQQFQLFCCIYIIYIYAYIYMLY